MTTTVKRFYGWVYPMITGWAPVQLLWAIARGVHIMENLQPTRGQTLCRNCACTTWHAEVLVAYPTRDPKGDLVTRFKRDWACIRCYHTIENGPLPMEVSDTFCIIADTLYTKKPTLHGDRPDIAGGPNLPFGNK